MKITIRTRALKTGSRSIYLDFYEKGERWSEYLNLFLVPDDTPDAKRLNDASMAKANEINQNGCSALTRTKQKPGAVNPTSYPNGFLPTGLTII